MKILFTLPGIHNPHGGYLNILEIITELQKYHETVDLFVESKHLTPAWVGFEHIHITNNRKAFKNYDVIVIGSPHSIWIEDMIAPHQRIILHMQMIEELFRPGDMRWKALCYKFYGSKHFLISTSKWGVRRTETTVGRSPENSLFIQDGINLARFPITRPTKDERTILLESPFSKNPAKDTANYAYQVAKRFKWCRIIGYGADPSPYPDVEYYQRPDNETLNRLYERATILIKATKYDFSSLAPLQAMTKGCVTARALNYGDDYLIHGETCLRSEYDREKLSENAAELLYSRLKRTEIMENNYKFVGTMSWENVVKKYNEIINQNKKPCQTNFGYM